MDTFANVILDSQEQVNNMSINGQNMQHKTKLYFCTCGNCNRMLAQFNPGEQLVNVINYINTTMKNDIKYCAGCGARLSYSAGIIDVPVVEVEKANNN